MPVVMTPPPELEGHVGPEEARNFLIQFLDWAWDFFNEIANNVDGDLNVIFIKEPKEFLRDALGEGQRVYEFARADLNELDAEHIAQHGLYGMQLRIKLTIIRSWFERFSDSLSSADLWRLYRAIISLLKSLLAKSTYGQGFIEMAEFIENMIGRDGFDGEAAPQNG